MVGYSHLRGDGDVLTGFAREWRRVRANTGCMRKVINAPRKLLMGSTFAVTLACSIAMGTASAHAATGSLASTGSGGLEVTWGGPPNPFMRFCVPSYSAASCTSGGLGWQYLADTELVTSPTTFIAGSAVKSAGGASRSLQSGTYRVNLYGHNLTDLLATGVFTISGGGSSSSSTTAPAPDPVVQQFGKPVSGTCDAAAPESLNWAGVASGGWGESWAQWANGGIGGPVCTRTLIYSESRAAWVVQ